MLNKRYKIKLPRIREDDIFQDINTIPIALTLEQARINAQERVMRQAQNRARQLRERR